MADVFTKAKRSEVMASIRGSGNKATELALIRVFRTQGITGWRRKWPVFGRPDFVFPKLRLAIFVDGCLWHSCPLHATSPKANSDYWRKKFATNRAQDQLVTRTLRKQGWSVLRIREHEHNPSAARRMLARLRLVLARAALKADGS